MIAGSKTLEEYQAEAYNDAVGSYTFECDCEALGISSKENPELVAKKPGIRLHFLRYGIFNDEPQKPHKQVKSVPRQDATQKDKKVKTMDGCILLDEVEVCHPKGAPAISGYSYASTNLLEGYIYIMDDSDMANKGLEYKVDGFGGLMPIFWKKGCKKEGNEGYFDIREPEGKEKEIIFEQDTIVWVAFSPVQWTVAFHKEMRENSQKREERMVKINCSGFKKGQENPHSNAYPYDEIAAHFTNEQIAEPQWLRCKLEQLQADDNEEEELKEDMFIALHDPISCADDIAVDLAMKHAHMEALIESLHTGMDDEIILERKLRGEERSESYSEKEKQISALVLLAQTSYQYVYNDEERREKYDGGKTGFWNWETSGYGVKEDKLLNVLGVKKRNEIREQIIKYRDSLGSYLQSDYYKKHWRDYKDNLDLRKVEGKFRLLQQLSLLAIAPYDLDKQLCLKKDYENFTDYWEPFLKEIANETSSDPLKVLLSEKTNLDQAVEEAEAHADNDKIVDLTNKAAGVISGFLHSFGKLAIQDKLVEYTFFYPSREINTTLKMVFSWLQTTTVGGKDAPQDVFQVRTSSLEEQLEKANAVLDKSKVKDVIYSGKKPLSRMALSPEIVLVKSRGNNIVELPVIQTVTEEVMKSEKISKTIKVKNSYAAKAQVIFDSKIFAGSIRLLQAFNLAVAVKNLGVEQNTKSLVNLAGVGTEFTSAILHYKRASLLRQGFDKAAPIVTTAEKRALFLGKVGTGFTVAMCLWEAVDSYHKNNEEQAMAWTGAAAAFAVTMFNIPTIPSLVAGVFGLGFVVTAHYLENTPLEKLFKHYPLGDIVPFEPLAGEKPCAYNKRLVANVDKVVVKENFKQWTNFKIAYQDLVDLIVGADVELIPGKADNIQHPPAWSATHTIKITNGDINSFSVRVSFLQFLEREDQFEYYVYFFENGIGKSVGENLRIGSGVCLSMQEKKAAKEIKPSFINLRANQQYAAHLKRKPFLIPTAEVEFSIPPKYLKKRNKNSEILFICRLNLQGADFYPFNYEKQQRFLGVRAKTYFQTTEVKGLHNGQSDSRLFRSNVSIDTLEKLMTNEGWTRL